MEKLQRNVLKVIYGFHTSYSEAIEKSGLETLQDRRQRLFDRFALKAADDPRFKKWFPRKVFTHPNLRRELLFEEKFAHTERLYRSPVYAMRRRLNTI